VNPALMGKGVGSHDRFVGLNYLKARGRKGERGKGER
jgi:hypothetical protein